MLEGRTLELEYLDYLMSVRVLADHTRKAYARDLESWKTFLDAEEKTFLQADRTLAGAFLGGLKGQGLSSASVNRTLSCLRGFYRFLIRRSLVSASPFGVIKNLKQPKRLPVFLFEKEMGVLLGMPGEGFQGRRDAFILELLYSTGCRVSEVTGADLKDLSGDRHVLRVLGKGSKIREVFLGPDARRALDQYLPLRELVLDRSDEDGKQALLLNRRGGRLHNLGLAKMLAHYVKKAGIIKGVTPHTLRHTFATHLLQEGLDIRVVQELLGHSRLSTTQVYTHLDLDRLRDVVRGAHPHG